MDWKTIDAAIEDLSLLKHPFYQAWTAGQLTKEDLRVYAQEYYHMERNFPRLVSRVHSNCLDAETRRLLVENLVDEELGADNHRELWLRFAEGLGLSREEVVSSEPSPKTRASFESLMSLCSGDVVDGLAALYAYESQLPRVSESKIQGLKNFYGMTDAKALGFFTVHKTADVWHSQVERKAIEAAGGDAARVKAAAQTACEALRGFLDGVDRDTRLKREPMVCAAS